MYLSKIDIVGFKSFANKIHVKFDTGMTAIVGPNGCGKTNVVDAIRWALGEQKPSMLRSDKMEDVIFNGTKGRKPLGMAEVALSIENTKGILPIEFSEVTITRRVYRSGESEYYLNGTLCRLKDIRDLFMDTGMGSDAYSVIELKMVETILSDNADERRHMFEEASGIVKYKHRRKETLRRLSNVQQDLTRVNDIYTEVEKAVNSLDRQSKKAEQFNLFSKELKELEINLLEREFSQICIEIEPLEKNLVLVKDEKENISTKLKKGESELENLKTGLDDLEFKLSSAQENILELQEKINLSKQDKISSAERKSFLTDAIKKYEKEILSLNTENEELSKNIIGLKTKVEIAKKEYEDSKTNFDEKNIELIENHKIQNIKKDEVKLLQDKIINLLHELTEIRNQIEINKARIENIHGRIESANEVNIRFQKEIIENAKEIENLTHQDKELRHSFVSKEVAMSEVENSKSTLQKEIDNLKKEEFEIKSLLERKNNRLNFLKSLVESHDGIPVGAKYLLSESEIKNSIFNTVGEIFETSNEYLKAVESSIGDLSSVLVVENISDAHRGIEILKKANKGNAIFVCLDRISEKNHSEHKISGAKEIKNILKFDKKFNNLANFIFGNIYLVDSIVDAIAITNENKSISCVTINGELVSNNGIVKGGVEEANEASLISKKSQIQLLEKEIEQLRDDIKKINTKILDVENEVANIKISDLKLEVKSIEQKMTAIEMRIAQIEYEKRRMEEVINGNNEEIKKLNSELVVLEEIIKELTPKLKILEDDKSVTEQNSGASKNELQRIDSLVAEMVKSVNDAKILLVQKENVKNNIEREVDFVNSSIENINKTISQRVIDIEKSKLEITDLDKKLIDINTQLNLFTDEFKEKDSEKKIIDSEVTHKRKTVHSIELKIKDERQLHDTSINSLHEFELKLSKLKTRKELIISIAKEEFELELKIKNYPIEPVFNLEVARNEIHQKKEKLKNIGAVNFAAFDEYKSEKERLDFMTVQRNDLIEAEATLLNTIEEINTTAKKMFLDTFGIIKENFVSIFKELFDEGDECDLVLEQDVDPLEAHIQIIAKPKGKRPTSIDLLSGGEKTLTAIALLFAIYLVKPSPFCILDEVDAPLDDSNIDKYCRIIRKFSLNTQFIIVTHNKRTMESANAMYGVTMEEEGVSKLVSVRFNESVLQK